MLNDEKAAHHEQTGTGFMLSSNVLGDPSGSQCSVGMIIECSLTAHSPQPMRWMVRWCGGGLSAVRRS